MMKKYAAVTVMIIVFVYSTGYSQQPPDSVLTLRQCVEIALFNNQQIKQIELQAQTDYVNLKQAKSNRLPQVVAGLNHGMNQGRSINPFTNSYVNQNVNYGNYNLSGGVNVFNGGQVKNFIRQNAYSLDASRMDLQQVKENTTLDIILAYLQVLNNTDLVQQSQNQFALTQNQVARLEILNKEGSIVPAQLYELKGQLANDELTFVNNVNALDASTLLLCQLMNIPYRKIALEKIVLKDNPIFKESDPAAIYQSSVLQFPAVRAAALRRRSEEAGIKVAKGQYYPGITAGADLYTNYSSAANTEIFQNTVQVPSGDFVDVNGTKVPVITTRTNFNSQKIQYADQFKNNYSTSLSVNIRIPILNFNQARNRVAQAKVQFKNAEFLEQSAKTELSQNIEEAYFNITAAYRKYETLQNQVNNFAEAFKIAEVRFTEGVTNQVEYLIAKNNLDRANINLIIARYDYIFRTKILDYYQGKLTL